MITPVKVRVEDGITTLSDNGYETLMSRILELEARVSVLSRDGPTIQEQIRNMQNEVELMRDATADTIQALQEDIVAERRARETEVTRVWDEIKTGKAATEELGNEVQRKLDEGIKTLRTEIKEEIKKVADSRGMMDKRDDTGECDSPQKVGETRLKLRNRYATGAGLKYSAETDDIYMGMLVGRLSRATKQEVTMADLVSRWETSTFDTSKVMSPMMSKTLFEWILNSLEDDNKRLIHDAMEKEDDIHAFMIIHQRMQLSREVRKNKALEMNRREYEGSTMEDLEGWLKTRREAYGTLKALGMEKSLEMRNTSMIALFGKAPNAAEVMLSLSKDLMLNPKQSHDALENQVRLAYGLVAKMANGQSTTERIGKRGHGDPHLGGNGPGKAPKLGEGTAASCKTCGKLHAGQVIASGWSVVRATGAKNSGTT